MNTPIYFQVDNSPTDVRDKLARLGAKEMNDFRIAQSDNQRTRIAVLNDFADFLVRHTLNNWSIEVK